MKKIVLVGLGHAHLHVLTKASDFVAAGAELILIEPGDFWYSGLATGLLSGRARPEDDRVDAADFAAACGGRLIKARVESLDPSMRQVVLENGDRIDYDAVSFNVGSTVSVPFAVNGENVWTAKPIPGLWRLAQRLDTPPPVHSLAVVGGGVTGCELISNLSARFGPGLDMTLIAGSDRLMGGWPVGAARAMQRLLETRGVTVKLGCKVQNVSAGQIHLEGGKIVAADEVLLATGLAAAPVMGRLSLPFDARHGLGVNARLHSDVDENVFAVGDCAEIAGHELPKIGVFGVRAAPVLAHNLLARVAGGPLRAFQPQTVWFSALNLGDGTGLAGWGPAWWRGKSALWLKNRFDYGFVRRYQKIAERRDRSAAGPTL